MEPRIVTSERSGWGPAAPVVWSRSDRWLRWRWYPRSPVATPQIAEGHRAHSWRTIPAIWSTFELKLGSNRAKRRAASRPRGERRRRRPRGRGERGSIILSGAAAPHARDEAAVGGSRCLLRFIVRRSTDRPVASSDRSARRPRGHARSAAGTRRGLARRRTASRGTRCSGASYETRSTVPVSTPAR